MTQTPVPDILDRDPERELLLLAAGARDRRRRRLAWTAAVVAGGLALLLLVWEAAVGPAAGARIAGYLAAAALAGAAGTAVGARWRAPAADPAALAGSVERLFPQARGGLSDALALRVGELGRARAAAGRAWLARLSPARLDRALAAEDRPEIARRRRLTIALALCAAGAAFLEPAAARRVAGAFVDPAALLRSGGSWSVEPGDARLEYGEAVSGRASFRGPESDGPLVLEARSAAGAWRAETLSAGPAGRWDWPSLREDLVYRLRFGPFTSPAHRIEVAAPLAVVGAEARSPGGAWATLGGAVLPAGEEIEVRGRATGNPASAAVRLEDGSEISLRVSGGSLAGAFRLRAGGAELVVRDRRGIEASGARFRVAGPGGVLVEILRPADDPVTLAASGAWLEVRAAGPAGLSALVWETADGRSGTLGRVAGARDTVVAALVPLAAGRAPGDSIRYRAVARVASGGTTSSGWRTAVVASREVLRSAADSARAESARALDRELANARAAAREPGGGLDLEARVRAEGLDRRLRAAADSLGRSLDRSLGDPELRAGLAERLETYRRLLDGASRAPVDPSAELAMDPAAALAARADVLKAVRRGLARVDSLMAMAAAADTLGRLSEAEAELAARTREAEPAELGSGIAARQAEVAGAAEQASAALPDSLAAGIPDALEAAQAGIEAGDPAAAAEAMEFAAQALGSAARRAEEEVRREAERGAVNRAAFDRAGAEVLFLAERQREIARRIGRPGAEAHADRLARQRVVAQGLEATLGALVEAIGGRPAAVDLAERLVRALQATRRAERAVAAPPDRPGLGPDPREAADQAARALALLARAFLLPDGEGGAGAGAGAAGRSGALARELEAMAGAERSIAAAVASAAEPSGGNPEAAAAQRAIGKRLGGMAEELEETGVDARTVLALEEAIERAAAGLERGLAGAQSETELRSLARRMADLGRIVQRTSEERRRSETARPFLPAEPPPLPARATARRLDPDAALAGWEAVLPRDAARAARDYLERLAAAGVREPGGPDAASTEGEP